MAWRTLFRRLRAKRGFEGREREETAAQEAENDLERGSNVSNRAEAANKTRVRQQRASGDKRVEKWRKGSDERSGRGRNRLPRRRLLAQPTQSASVPRTQTHQILTPAPKLQQTDSGAEERPSTNGSVDPVASSETALPPRRGAAQAAPVHLSSRLRTSPAPTVSFSSATIPSAPLPRWPQSDRHRLVLRSVLDERGGELSLEGVGEGGRIKGR